MTFLPEWSKFGKASGVIRNTYIINYADQIIIFWDRKSKGTLDVINKCKRKGKSYKIVRY